MAWTSCSNNRPAHIFQEPIVLVGELDISVPGPYRPLLLSREKKLSLIDIVKAIRQVFCCLIRKSRGPRKSVTLKVCQLKTPRGFIYDIGRALDLLSIFRVNFVKLALHFVLVINWDWKRKKKSGLTLATRESMKMIVRKCAKRFSRPSLQTKIPLPPLHSGLQPQQVHNFDSSGPPSPSDSFLYHTTAFFERSVYKGARILTSIQHKRGKRCRQQHRKSLESTHLKSSAIARCIPDPFRTPEKCIDAR